MRSRNRTSRGSYHIMSMGKYVARLTRTSTGPVTDDLVGDARTIEYRGIAGERRINHHGTFPP